MKAETKTESTLRSLQKYGQSFWLDYIRRSLISGGELQSLIEEDGLQGITSNPTIFEKAIAGSRDYNDSIRHLVTSSRLIDTKTLFEKLAVRDVQMAADLLRPLFNKTGGADGFVSLELPPELAYDTKGSIVEARRLWKELDRPNVMLKVPATQESHQVIETLIAEGVNVNVTLIFSVSQYESIAQAHLRGLDRCSEPGKVASVASFFLSRIDTIVDKWLESISTPKAKSLKGKVAIATAKLAYKRFNEIFSGQKWEQLRQRGAKVQRLLWASTSTKNPAYSDVRYVEQLIGPNTVNTIPPKTIDAFKDHGNVNSTLENDLVEAQYSYLEMEKLGINFEEIAKELQVKGVKAFADSFNKLLVTLDEKRQNILNQKTDFRVLNLGKYQNQVGNRLEYWHKTRFLRRLWAKDSTLWFSGTVAEITDRLGWLFLPEAMHEQLEDLEAFAEEIKAEGITDVVLLGMGGSSLAPDVFQKTFGNTKGYPKLTVLDSTHPQAVKKVEETIDPTKTLFVVSSKSGTTTETISFFRYFWKKITDYSKQPGRHFIAITDPNTPLESLATERNFRRVFRSSPDVGGRYSALTFFGLVPAALIGMDLHEFLDQSLNMVENCAFCVSPRNTYGLTLGAALGEAAKSGRNKATFFASPSLSSFPVWLEQLIAESTGKDGKGIIPIVHEPPSSPSVYGTDRFFVVLNLENEKDDVKGLMKQLEGAGHPTLKITLTDKIKLSQEIFCWEMAIASAGAILKIHPFNQPNVEIAKDLARKMMKQKRKLSNQEIETTSTEDPGKLQKALKGWLKQARAKDYVAIQAYLAPSHKVAAGLQQVRLDLLDGLHLATTLGYGPRFLHSTGQLHKGGPNTGLFLQLVDEIEDDLKVPETDYTFGSLIQAQALGDYQALRQLGRRVLRVNLKTNTSQNLSKLIESLKDEIETLRKERTQEWKLE